LSYDNLSRVKIFFCTEMVREELDLNRLAQ
jgi:hypothetical protein